MADMSDEAKKQRTTDADERFDEVMGDAGAEPEPLPTETASVPNIHQAIVGMMREVEAIGKTRKNKGQGWLFRGIDDVYNFVHPHLCKWGVYLTSEILEETHSVVTTSGGKSTNLCIMRMRYVLTAEDGTSAATEVSGEGTDTNDKSTACALSMAYKYAFFQLLCIPIDNVDPDAGPEAHANPTANPDSPKVKPRGERYDVSREELVGILNTYIERIEGAMSSKFGAWFNETCGTEYNLSQPGTIPRSAVVACCKEMGVE